MTGAPRASNPPPLPSADWSDWQALLIPLLTRMAAWLPEPPVPIDWHSTAACRWRQGQVLGSSQGWLEALAAPNMLALEQLHHLDRQIDAVERNTQQFLAGFPANNVLLTGARGTGKSSLIQGLLLRYAPQGLRLIEVDKADLVQLPDLLRQLPAAPWRFLVFCDDLSFEGHEPAYKALKAALDGSLAAPRDRVLIYATSNRRNLMPEKMRDNLTGLTDAPDGDVNPAENTEEKVALAERFGLWLSFPSLRQEAYLDIAGHWLAHFGCDAAAIHDARPAALQWALTRGARSGRVAWQFAKDWAGRRAAVGNRDRACSSTPAPTSAAKSALTPMQTPELDS